MKKFLALTISLLFISSFFAEIIEAKSRGGSSGGFRSSGSSSSSSSRSSYSGSSSSSRPSSSYSSPSRSTYSSPSRSTYPSGSYDNRNYSNPSGNYGSGYSTPYQNTPGYTGGGTTIVPIYGGSSGVATGTSSSGGGAIFLIIILVIVGVVVFVIIKNRKKKGSGEVEDGTTESHLFFVQAGFYYGKGELEKSLIETSKAVDTGEMSGLLTLLREVSMLIRRNKDNIRWFNFKQSKHANESSAEAAFNKLVTDERMNVDVEEFTDQNGMEVDRKTQGDNLEEVIVISMAVACHSNVLLDDGITFENFEKLISFFSAIPEDSLLGTNVIWNIMDKDEMISDCPELRGV